MTTGCQIRAQGQKTGFYGALAEKGRTGRFPCQCVTGSEFDGQTGHARGWGHYTRVRARYKGPANFLQAGRSCHYAREVQGPPMQQLTGANSARQRQ
jgi:hypothetical protein